MHTKRFVAESFRGWLAAVLIVASTMALGSTALASLCGAPDNGTGTITLPPSGPGCPDGYENESGPLLIIDGLPPGTTIEIDAELSNHLSIINYAGGSLGGMVEEFDSVLELNLAGTGALAGFNRTMFMPLNGVSHSAPRTPGDLVQTFAADMYEMVGQIYGDPDFDTLQFLAGTNFGLPSPGHTTLTQLGLPGSDFNVDSFFDITYRIDFAGAPGGVLDGLSGSTTGTVRIQAGEPWEPCPPSPHLGCQDAFDKGLLLVNEKVAGKEKMIAKWIKGPALAGTDFGNPLSGGGTAYTLCIYNDVGSLAGEYNVARAGDTCGTKECWKNLGKDPGDPGHKGYKYKDKDLVSDGIMLMLMKGGDAGRSKALVKGKAIPPGAAGNLNGSLSARVQLFGSDAPECISVTLPTVLKDNGVQFKAKK